MKITTIHVSNFKAVSEQLINLNGASAIVTAGNRQGKTSVLRGLIDRLRSEKPDCIVKEGEKKGFNHIELSDGSRIEWNFTDKTESFAYITPDGIKMTTGVIQAIGEKYFGKSFDIDKFILSSDSQQVKEIQRLCGLDFTDIDARYKVAYDERTEANRELRRVSAMQVGKPVKAEKPDIDKVKAEIKEAKEFNEEQLKLSNTINYQRSVYDDIIQHVEETEFEQFFDNQKALEYINKLPQGEPLKDIEQLEAKLETANGLLRQYDAYERDLKSYNDWIEQGKKARTDAEKADEKVKAIEDEKKALIASAKMPEGFEIIQDTLNYNGYPLSNSNQSTSEKYIAALKLGAMALGKVKTLHFDASALDKKSLTEVQEWANSEGLQLLIERPDYDGGEIKYQIIEN